jgi:hypothetical protein
MICHICLIICFTCLCLYLCTVVTWRDATSEPMNSGPIFLTKTTTNLPLHALLFFVIIYSKNTKTLPTIRYAHNLLQLAKLVRLTTSLDLLGTQVKIYSVLQCYWLDSWCCLYGLIAWFHNWGKLAAYSKPLHLGAQQLLPSETPWSIKEQQWRCDESADRPVGGCGN